MEVQNSSKPAPEPWAQFKKIAEPHLNLRFGAGLDRVLLVQEPDPGNTVSLESAGDFNYWVVEC